jgi:hypothetical protein
MMRMVRWWDCGERGEKGKVWIGEWEREVGAVMCCGMRFEECGKEPRSEREGRGVGDRQ